jgi:hypothetical protein
MTYRVDSDILFPYGEVMDKETKHFMAPAINIKWKQAEEDFTGEHQRNLENSKH